jgi:4-hydroxy-2-oxoheptanedioate aldolase
MAEASLTGTRTMIEDVEALEALTEITNVAGLDALFGEPADLAMSMGVPGGATCPAVQARVHRAAKDLTDLEKVVGTTFVEA